MSTAAAYQRYPLGLPAGSVRSLLTLMVTGMICILVLVSPIRDNVPVPIPPYLVYLLFLITGCFFAAHGSTIGRHGSNEPSPWYLPRGTMRLLVLAILIATAVWKMVNHPQAWADQLNVTVDHFKGQPYLPIIILGAFFIGHILRMLLSGAGGSAAYQDILAWIAIIAVVLMVIDSLIIGVINPSLISHEEVNLADFEAVLAGIIAFYFAARS